MDNVLFRSLEKANIDMKKILFVVNVDWFFISHRLPLAIEAKNKGYEVHIACAITYKKEYLEQLGFIIHPLILSRSGVSIQAEIKAFFSIYKVLKEIKPTIIHFVTIKPVIYGGIASRFCAIEKRIFSISGLGFIFIKQGFKASLIRAIVKILYNLALGGKNSHVIVQNLSDNNVVESIVNVPISLIRGSGVNLEEYTYKEENLNSLKVVMASRLLKDKGVNEYIEAAKLLKEKGLEVAFELYGDIDSGNPTTLTREDIDQIQKDGFVKINGFSQDIANIFSNANLVVLPSYREGLPKVLIEAAACGRAVVTTDVPGCKDAIEPNTTGLLCKVKDANSLAKLIEKLINDQKLRLQMGKQGRDLAQKEFDIKMVVSKHFEIYEDML